MTEATSIRLELVGKDAHATAEFRNDLFFVLAGSVARRESVPSAPPNLSVRRGKLISEGVLEETTEGLQFTRDCEFDSPSGAAMLVMGRSANGWIEWKTADGQKLSQVRKIDRNVGEVLGEELRQRIISHHAAMVQASKLPTPQQLQRQYDLFRSKFGPQVLRSLDGEHLLSLMHDLSNRDSLVYWLEFKNDEEFETARFGSIAGGSAMKFRLFRRKETGVWQAGSEKGNQPQDISLEKAIEIARDHRDQLLRGTELLNQLPADATDEDYALLQDQMTEQAPDVSRLGWGHKYFSLLYPDKLDDYQSVAFQKFIQRKLLLLPPQGDGRYACAGRFVAASREVDIPIANFGGVLNDLFGTLHRYWRIGTSVAGQNAWPDMRDQSFVAIGWMKLGDLSWLEATETSKEKLRQLMEEHYPNTPSAVGRQAKQFSQFTLDISEGDIVLAANGANVLGIGKVIGGYEFHPGNEWCHRRQVEWLDISEWTLPVSKEGLQSTVREIKRHDENLVAIEAKIQNATPVVAIPTAGGVTGETLRNLRLSGIPGRIQSILERKGQVILYGPPGTGKTYWAERTARDLAAGSSFGKAFDSLNENEQTIITGSHGSDGLVRLCCFHPAYGYEDFIEGYRPSLEGGQVAFVLRDGIFKKLCRDAVAQPDRHFYLIVDEINRGDIPRIFGELLTILEKDKREKRLVLPVSQESFSVPRNVFLIGTMNTADRSISLLDAALRRRFGFVELMPDGSVLKDAQVGGIPLRAWFDALNARIREHVGRDARNLQIGHSYLMQGGYAFKDLATLRRAVRDDILPLLQEYCYEEYERLAEILGEQLVDKVGQRIRDELFDERQEEALIQALLSSCADITTSTAAIAAEEVQVQSTDQEGDDE
jgi:5-methylcytosine-specific restriction protein B